MLQNSTFEICSGRHELCCISTTSRQTFIQAIKSLKELICLPGNNLFKIHNFAVTCMRDRIEKNWLSLEKTIFPQNTDYVNGIMDKSLCDDDENIDSLLQQMFPIPITHLQAKLPDFTCLFAYFLTTHFPVIWSVCFAIFILKRLFLQAKDKIRNFQEHRYDSVSNS